MNTMSCEGCEHGDRKEWENRSGYGYWRDYNTILQKENEDFEIMVEYLTRTEEL